MRPGPYGPNTVCNKCGLKYKRLAKKVNDNPFGWDLLCPTNNTFANTYYGKNSLSYKNYLFTSLETINIRNCPDKITLVNSHKLLKEFCCNNIRNDNNIWYNSEAFYCQKCDKKDMRYVFRLISLAQRILVIFIYKDKYILLYIYIYN